MAKFWSHESEKVVRFNHEVSNALINDIYKTLITCITMDFIKSEIDKEFESISFKNQRRNLRSLPQTAKNKTDKTIDASRKALMPGKRISKTGKVYWETRANRSDSKGSKI